MKWMKHVMTVAVLAFGVSGLQAGEDKAGAEGKNEEGWVTLFDGKTMDGWKVNENNETWKIVDGALVCKGDRSHIFYVGDEAPYTDFEFQADVMTKPKSNAGIYFHTKFQETGWPKFGYEAQVNNTHGDPKKTGSLYAVNDVLKAPAEDNKWFTMFIRVKGRQVTIQIDGKTVMEYTEPEGKEAFSNDFERRLGSGTFCLQGHDPISEVHFKNIKARHLK